MDGFQKDEHEQWLEKIERAVTSLRAEAERAIARARTVEGVAPEATLRRRAHGAA